MACCFCVCFSQGSKTWLALFVPIFAVFARFSITLSALLILFSTLFFLIFSKQKPILVQENPTDSSSDDFVLVREETVVEKAVKKFDEQGAAIASQDLYSESESMDQFSSTSSEDHSSDIEWPYNIGQRVDCSDDSISDEESLIEIAIPSGQFVSPDRDPRLSENCYSKCCEDFSHQESMLYQKDFWADINEMNEEDNLIEIDIYMGSIKCSSFEI